MNARYQDPVRGQFINEDPVFLGNPKQQNLQDPQSLNAYSYSEDNPIVKEDQNGKCPWCYVAAAVFGGVSGAVYQGFQNYQNTGTIFPGSLSQNIEDYGAATAEGAATGFGAAYVGTLAVAAELPSILTFGAVGGTAGGLNFGLTAGGNAITGQPTNYSRLVYDSSIDAITAGALTYLPGVRGVLPGSLDSALDFLDKAHAARWGAESSLSTSMSMLGSSVEPYINQNGGGTGYGGSIPKSNARASIPVASGTPSPYLAGQLGIGNPGGRFVGTYTFAPGQTFNFGTGQWQK
jgi:hypothetical protein